MYCAQGGFLRLKRAVLSGALQYSFSIGFVDPVFQKLSDQVDASYTVSILGYSAHARLLRPKSRSGGENPDGQPV